ncbi:hypothetical protein M5K25_017839 [Dendrobium thyrsiflorum]|uniref:Uncharacterized protein n=1 Tax=Dendrobium thyrsiflorum TaxID=117978 RepID=A0ABD0UGW3_DENTH
MVPEITPICHSPLIYFGIPPSTSLYISIFSFFFIVPHDHQRMPQMATAANRRCFLDMSIGGLLEGRIVVELNAAVAPERPRILGPLHRGKGNRVYDFTVSLKVL